jgi:hypothetical protein
MRNKLTVTTLLMAICSVFLLGACDGATVSDSIPRPTHVVHQVQSSGSPTLIGSFPSKDTDGSPSDDEVFHYLFVTHNIRLELVSNDGTMRFFTHIKDGPITLAVSLILIGLGIYVLSRRGQMNKNRHK